MIRPASDSTSPLKTEPLAVDERRATESQSETELAVSHIVRPHLFHVAEVSGLLVPVLTISSDGPAGKWLLLLHWADGKRECRKLPNPLELLTGDNLWFSSVSSATNRIVGDAWSAKARRRFLEGKYTPDVAKLFNRLQEAFRRFVSFPEEEAEGATAVLALWTMLTYAFPAWSVIPYLSIGGPMGSGKTRVFEVLNRIVYRPLPSANMTAPCMFRTLDAQGGTLLLDEAERLRDRTPAASEIRSILLSGYKAGNPARRLEPTAGGKYKPIEFDVYGPKAIAGIASLPEALESRCIRLTMFRAPTKSPEARRRIDENPRLWMELRDDLHAFALTQGSRFVELSRSADLCSEFGNRDYELWQPLIALASTIQEAGTSGLVRTVKEFAGNLIESRVADQTPEPDAILLRHLAGLVKKGDHDETPGDLLAVVMLSPAQDGVFRRWGPKGASHALARYGIRTTKSTNGRRTYRYVTLDQLRRVENRYGVDLGLSTATIATNATSPASDTPDGRRVASSGISGRPVSPPSDLGGESGESGDQEAGCVPPSEKCTLVEHRRSGEGEDLQRSGDRT